MNLDSSLPVFIPAVVALVSSIGGFVVAVVQRQDSVPRQYRRLGHLVDMLAKAPDGDGRKEIEGLVVQTARTIAAVPTRKVNVLNLILAVALAAIVTAVMFGLAQWIVAAAGTLWVVVAWGVAIIVGIISILFVGAGFATIFAPPKK